MPTVFTTPDARTTASRHAMTTHRRHAGDRPPQTARALPARSVRMPIDKLHRLAHEEPAVAADVGRRVLDAAVQCADGPRTFGQLLEAVAGPPL